MVRPERFELPTSWFVARRSIQLSYGRALVNQTPAIRISGIAYGLEAQAAPRRSRTIGGEGGIRTLDGLLTHTPLAGARLRPLGHLSGRGRRPKSRSAG